LAAAGRTGGLKDGEGDGEGLGVTDTDPAELTTGAGLEPVADDELEPPVHPATSAVETPTVARVRRM
jgi:hypothetical protein